MSQHWYVNTSLDDVSAGLDLGANLTLPEGPIKDYSQYINCLEYTSPEHTFGENEDAFLGTGTYGFRKLGSLSSSNFEFVFSLNKSKRYA